MLFRLLRYFLYLLGALAVWVGLLFAAVAVIEHRVPVKLPYYAEVLPIGDGYVKATGTWVILGEQQAFPLQTTEITCEREIKRCSSATAQVMLGKRLTAHLEFFDVVAWETGRIVFANTAPRCVSYIYTIDLASKSVAGVRRKKDGVNLPADCSDYATELRLNLVQGTEVGRKLEDEAVPWFGHIVLAPLKLLR